MQAIAPKVFEKRLYQDDCLKALKKAFRNGALWALFVLATGLGKTYVALLFLQWLLKKIAGEKNGTTRRPRVLVLCHQKPILRQLLKEFRQFLGENFTYQLLNPLKMKRLPDVDVLFSTFQAMRGRRRRFPVDYFDVLIVDEGHHSKADSYEPTIRYFKARFRYAMTATPNRMDLREISEIFGEPVYRKPLAQALAEKLLPKVVYKLFLETTAKSVKEAVGDKKPSRNAIDQKYFVSEASEAHDREIVRTIIKEMGQIENPRVLVFCQTIRHCNRMTTYLTEEGARAAAVHSNIDDDEQENRLEGLKSGQLNVLVARDVLNEGKDIPAINLVAVIRSTGSATIFEQQIGRGLRPGKAELIVLDFVANCERIENIARLVEAVKTVLKKKKKKTRKEREDETLDGSSISALMDDCELPIQVISGAADFDFVYRDLIKILGSMQVWTLSSGKASFLALAEMLGKKALTLLEITDGSKEGLCPSYGWLRQHLAPKTGHLPEALEAIGLEAEERWTLDSGKAAFLALARTLKKKTLTRGEIIAGSKKEICPSFTWLQRHFAPKTRGLLEAIEAIGLEVEKPWTRQAGKAAFLALAKRLGKKTLIQDDIKRGKKDGSCPSYLWLRKRFAPKTHRLAEALRAIGLEARDWTLASGKAAFQKLATKLRKKTLTLKDVTAGNKKGVCPTGYWLKSKLAPETGGMNEALKALGMRK